MQTLLENVAETTDRGREAIDVGDNILQTSDDKYSLCRSIPIVPLSEITFSWLYAKVYSAS